MIINKIEIKQIMDEVADIFGNHKLNDLEINFVANQLAFLSNIDREHFAKKMYIKALEETKNEELK